MTGNWQSVTVGDISDLVTKGATPTSYGFKYQESGINFVKVESIRENGTFKPEKFAHIDEACNQHLKRSILKESDILFSIAGALGRVAIVDQSILPANTNQALGIIRLQKRNDIFDKYIFRVLSSGMLQEQIEQQKGGVAQQNLSLTQLKNFIFPLPPLPEQERIVAILDKAFEGIDKAIAQTEQNLASARELFESYLNNIFTQKDAMRDNWQIVKLGDVFETVTGNTPSKKNKEYYGEDVPLVKPPQLHNSSISDSDDKLSNAGAEVARVLPVDSILVSCIGNLGKIGINTVKVAFNQQINAILPHQSKAIPKYLFHLCLSPDFRSQLESKSSGTTVPIVNKSKFNSISIPLPPLPEQERIVAILDKLKTSSHYLEALYTQKLNDLKELKQSLLQQAFAGELTKEDAA